MSGPELRVKDSEMKKTQSGECRNVYKGVLMLPDHLEDSSG